MEKDPQQNLLKIPDLLEQISESLTLIREDPIKSLYIQVFRDVFFLDNIFSVFVILLKILVKHYRFIIHSKKNLMRKYKIMKIY